MPIRDAKGNIDDSKLKAGKLGYMILFVALVERF